MSSFSVQILDPSINTLEIETSVGNNTSRIDILRYDNSNIVIDNAVVPFPADYINSIHTEIASFLKAGSGINLISNVSGVNINVSGLNSSYISNFNSSVDSRITSANLQPSGDYSLIGHFHNISNISGLQTSLDSKQPSGNYASSSHNHASSDITNFNNSVSGLLPITSLVASTGIGITQSGTVFTIAITGTLGSTQSQTDVDARINVLTSGIYAPLNGAVFSGSISGPSGNFTSLKVNSIDVSANGHIHTISDITNLQTTLDGKQPSGDYAASSHTHTASQITDFNTSVDSRITNANLQPSGNYSIIGHTHTSSNITDFNSSVIGLLPTNLVTGSGITNHIPYWSSTSGLLADSNQLIWDSTNNRLGIGTTTPSGLLDVAGDVYVRGTGNNLGTVYFKSSASSDTSLKIRTDSNGNLYLDAVSAFIRVGNLDGAVDIQSANQPVTLGQSYDGSNINQQVRIRTAGTERIRVTSNGLVGIGTNNPTERLEVSGALKLLNCDTRIVRGDNSNISLSGVGNNVGHFGLYIDNRSTAGGRLYRLASHSDGTVGSFRIRDDSAGVDRFTITSIGNVGIGTTTPSGQLHVIGTCIFDNSIRLGSPSSSGTIIGLSTSGTVPAIIFDTVGNNHGNQQALYDFRENGTSLISIDGAGNLQASAGNIVALATNPSADNGSFIGHGIRRRLSNAGMEFAWGESITSVSEPGIDLFPIGGTHISSGILFRLSKNSDKTNIAAIVDGNGNVGIGTSSPASQLHVIGSGIFASGLFIPNNASIRSSTSTGSEFNIIRCDTADNVRIERPSAASDTYIGSSTAFILKGNDRVGMGHVSPLNRLAINGATTIGANYNVSAPTNGLLVEGNVGIGTTTPSGQLHVIGTGIFSSGIIVGNGTVSNPSIAFDGSRTTGFSCTNNLLEASVVGNRVIRISQFGTVAINRGTGSALGTLHVQGNGSNPANTSDPLIVTSSVGSGSIIRFTDSASNDWQIGVNPNGSVQTGSSNGNFAITKIISNSGLAYVTINSSGNIGIGTNNPTERLEVAGNIKANNIIHPFLLGGM